MLDDPQNVPVLNLCREVISFPLLPMKHYLQNMEPDPKCSRATFQGRWWFKGFALIAGAFLAVPLNINECVAGAGGSLQKNQKPDEKGLSADRQALKLAKSYPEALAALNSAAAHGDSEAQYNLGERYLIGVGVIQDNKEAVSWCREAAEQGHAHAQILTGWIYNFGEAVPKDDVEANRWYRKAAEQGNARGQFNLGTDYDIGEGAPKDSQAAALWYRKAADQGLDIAQHALGWMYDNGEGVERDPVEAVRWYRKAAEKGLMRAQWMLGEKYRSGVGVEKNPEEAAEWTVKAEKQVRFKWLIDLMSGSDGPLCVNARKYGDVSAHRAKDPNFSPSWINSASSKEFKWARKQSWFRKSAEDGNAVAQINLGEMYEHGDGVVADPIEAARWYIKAANQGEAEAQFRLGTGNIILFEGKSGDFMPPDKLVERGWLLKAALQGHVRAQVKLGDQYYTDFYGSKDPAEAAKWYRKAAEQGNAEAQYHVGATYDFGEGVSKDLAEAVKWYRKSAAQGYQLALEAMEFIAPEEIKVSEPHRAGEAPDSAAQEAFGAGYAAYKVKDFAMAFSKFGEAATQGHAGAQTYLGALYGTGCGVTKDSEEAVSWFRKAADQGDAWAQKNLGFMYEKGDGVTKNSEEAVRWYRKAADQGNAIAQTNLGFMYARGEGVTKSSEEAVRWYRKAADQGNARAQNNLGSMNDRGEGVTKNPEEAVSWFRKAADQGDEMAQYNLGLNYVRGEGVTKDSKEGTKWFRMAANQGYATAQHGLGLMYFRGDGVPKNLIFAYKWLLLAKSSLNDKNLDKSVVSIESQLSRHQQEEGQRLAAAFSPKSDNGGGQKSTMDTEGLIPSQLPPPNGSSQPRPEPSAAAQVSFGTGFFISKSGAIVTAAHVVAKAKRMQARLPDGSTVLLQLLRVDEKLDLALLQAVIAGSPEPSILPIGSSRSLQLGQSVMTIGFPNPEVQGLAPKFTQGTISALSGFNDSPNTLQISVPVQPGNSGGALVDMSGCVVGVVVGRLNAVTMARETGALSENVNYAVKGTHLLAFLEGISASLVPPEVNKTPPPQADSETIEQLKNATVFITVEQQ